MTQNAPKSRSLARRLIVEADQSAERLIGIIRMVLSALLCAGMVFLLNTIDQSAFAIRNEELLFTLITTMVYFVLGFISYIAATWSGYKPWMALAFALTEVIILIANLFIDVRHPGTPTLFALASPLIVMIPIVLALQVLRYRLDIHIWVSVSLLILTAIVLFHDPQVGQTVSKPVLDELLLLYTVPPNVVRLNMLGCVALVIGISIFRSRRLMEKVALEAEELENQRRFLPTEISSNLTDDELLSLREGRQSDVVVMFADIRDFTALSEKMGTRETVDYLTQFRSLILDVAGEYDGVVDKFIGDGALIIFGLNSELPEASHNALSAGSELLSKTNAVGSGVQIALAAHAGPAIVGAIGDDRRLEFTVTGDVVNIASRLETMAKETASGFVFSEIVAESAKEVRGGHSFIKLGSRKIRGTSRSMNLFELDLKAE